MWQEWICPLSLTPVAQFLISFALGVLFSWWTESLALLIAFILAYEICYHIILGTYDSGSRWSHAVRMGVCLAYLAGWLLGRTVHQLDVSFLTAEDDHFRLREKSLCRRYRRRLERSSWKAMADLKGRLSASGEGEDPYSCEEI